MKQKTLLIIMQGMITENPVPLVIERLKKQPHIKELGGELSSNELTAFRQIMRKSIKDGEYIAQTEAADKQLKNDCQDEQTTIVVTDITNPILRDVAQENHY